MHSFHPLKAAENCPDTDKYRLAWSKCDIVVSALKKENLDWKKKAENADEQTDKAVKMAAEQNLGVPAEVWVIGGVLMGLGIGFGIARAL